MHLPGRRRKLDPEHRPPLDRDERVIAWAGTSGGEVVVVTNLGLWLPGGTGRIGWHEINKATWSARQLTVTAAREIPAGPATGVGEPVTGGYAIVADLPPVTVTLLDPDRVPEHVQTRVTRSVAYTTHHTLPTGGLRVVGRRVPGRDGLTWMVRYDDGSAGDPASRAAVDALVARARDSVVPPD